MDITWLGHAAFKIKTKTATIIIDPFDKAIGLPWAKQTADILLISHSHHDHNNRDGVETSFTADGPGEYEVKDVVITGTRVFHDAAKGSERGMVTAYSIQAEGLTICHLGDLGHELSGEQTEELQGADVLMIPVGGTYTIDAETAAKVVSQLEPHIVIPMHYQVPSLTLSETLTPVDPFLKALGKEGVTAQPSLKVSKDSVAEDLQVVVLEAKTG